MRRHSRLYLPIIAIAILSLATLARAQNLDILNLHFVSKGKGAEQLTIATNNSTEFRAFALSDPYRLVIDLPSFGWHPVTIDRPKGSIISDIRQGPLQENISRIVFDAAAPIRIIKSEYIQNKGLVIDYTATSKEDFRAHKNDIFGALTSDKNITPEMKKLLTDLAPQENFLKPASILTHPSTKEPEPQNTDEAENFTDTQEQQRPDDQKPIIVIDPGHGGIDPGAIGANNQKEKNVVLALGLELKKALEASGNYKVIMTRSKDNFLALKDRVNVARKKKGDLFISLHADSIHKSDVSGSSVYTLSKEASDAQTAKLAEKENNADLIAGVDLSIEDEQVAYILGDFLMTETLNQSKYFANMLVNSMKKKGVSVLDNTHRFAGFAVLKAPDIPSVLIETGFMSNQEEAALLNSEKHRKKIVSAIKSGIDAYFSHVGAGKNIP